MKKLIAMSAAVALLAGTSLAFADSKIETKCKDMATKDNISADKMDDYVKTCVKKHSMKHKTKKKTTSSTSSTTSTTTTTTPAPDSTSAPAAGDNMSNMPAK